MKSIRFAKYFSAYLSIGVILSSLAVGGIAVFIAPFYVFIVIPLMELFFGGDQSNMSEVEEELAKKDWKFDLVVYSVVPFQFAVFFFFLNRISDGSLAWWEIIGMIFSFGISCGVFGINVAHELGHRNSWYERLMSKMLLLTSLYMHFFIEHNRGHHKNVSTDEDPASAKYGESLYAFWFRSVKDGWLSAWHLEGGRLKKDSKAFWSIHNEMLWYQIVQVSMLAAITFVWGWEVMLFYLGAASTGFLLLETVNYIEHYGLRRKKNDNEYYDKTMPIHSWNSNHPMGRIMLFELSRHSDHHYMPSRKYQVLRNFDNSPQMPTGYTGMMAMSTIPLLWFAIMNPRIEKYKATLEGAALD
ncbi:MAG: alkane 1-monooxygenase [Bacteroidetes bacterium]|nr:alkane 1-monooxygenase [Bacteroidota bacterium]